MKSGFVFPNPQTGEEAKFSYPHILGTALLKRKVWLDSFTDESVQEAQYRQARNQVDVRIHPEWPPGRVDARTPVTIELQDGRRVHKEVAFPREPSMEQLLDRYREAAGGVLTPDQTDQSIDLLLRLEDVQDTSELMRCLTRTR